jgi:hypothetical protein
MEKKQILQQALMQLNDFVREQRQLASSENVFSLSEQTSMENASITLSGVDMEQNFSVIVQAWAPQKDINTLISQIKSMPVNAILFADFVNPVMAEKLRQRSIAFVDCAGNLSIKNKQLDLYVKGRKPARLRNKRVRGRAFNAAGLKLIFAVFNQPQFLHASYRDISNKINIALGSVGPVIDDLYSSGYILDDGERRLVNKKRLFERWVDGYLEKLRPKQIMACYSCDDKSWWNKADPDKFQGLWGGEVTIAKSTPFMMPETISLYFRSDKKHKEFAEFYGLRKDDEGEICMYKSFWSPIFAGENNIDGINPMIIYADIVDSINPGSWDVAKTFYGDAVAQLLQD